MRYGMMMLGAAMAAASPAAAQDGEGPAMPYAQQRFYAQGGPYAQQGREAEGGPYAQAGPYREPIFYPRRRRYRDAASYPEPARYAEPARYEDPAPPPPAVVAPLAAVVVVASAPAVVSASAVGDPAPAPMLSADETLWHVRAALNVAALACRGIGDGDTAAAYDTMLQVDRTVLAAAYAGVQARYRLRRGAAAAETAYDDDMTRLYNYFAQPPAHEAFCATARAVLDEARSVPAAELARFAPTALAALEAPFRQGFAGSASHEDASPWRAGPERPDRTVIATLAPIAVGPLGEGR